MPYLKFECCGKKWKKNISPNKDPVTTCRNCSSDVVANSYEELQFYCEQCDSEWYEYLLEDSDEYPVSQCEYCALEVVAESYEYLEFVCKGCRSEWDAYWHEEDDPVDECADCHREVVATAYEHLDFNCEPCDIKWSEYWPTSDDEDRMSECEGCDKLRVANTYVFRQFACGTCQKMWWKTVPQHNHLCYCIGRCRQWLKPIPRRKEYGIGEHICECGNEFHGRTQASVKSPCFRCGESCLPSIIPGKLVLRRKSRHTHKCESCNGQGDCIHFQRIIYTSEAVSR